MTKKNKNKKKISKKLSNILILSSVAAMFIYVVIMATNKVVRGFQPSSLGEVYQILGYLSLALALPSIVIAIAIFSRIMGEKSSWVYIVLTSLMPAVLIWVVSSIVLALLNIDPLTTYGIELV